jgi:hypothetical protein
MSDVAVALLAVELGITADELARRLHKQGVPITLCAATGMRMIDTAIAWDLCTERDSKSTAREAAAKAHRLDMQRLDAKHGSTRERVRAIRHHQEEMRAMGVIHDDSTALDIVCGAAKEASLARRGRRFEEMLQLNNTRGDIPYHKIRNEEN